MKTNITILTAIALLVAFSLNAQVAINTDGGAPDGSAMLEIESTTGGILIPKMTQAQRNAISNPATGLLIWQTNNTPGFYYNSGTPATPSWTGFGGSDDWTTTGNAGTNPSTNFLGTTDAQSLAIYSNNTERMRVRSDGIVTVNSTSAFTGTTFYTYASGNDDGISANASGSGDAIYGQQTGSGNGIRGYAGGTGNAIYGYQASSGFAVRGYNGGSGSGVIGLADNASSFGLYGYNFDASGTGLIASGNGEAGSYLTGGTGIAGAGADGVYGLGKDSDGTGVIGTGNDGDSVFTIVGGSGGAFTGAYGVYAKVDNNSTGTGVVGAGHNISSFSTTTTGSGGAFTGQQGVYGKGVSSTGTGVIGLGSNASGYYTHSNGSGVAGTGTYCGVYGVADDASGAGIYGYNANSSGWAGDFAGNVRFGTSSTQVHRFYGHIRAANNSDGNKITPNIDLRGYVGETGSGNHWRAMAAGAFNVVSQRELKRDIAPIEDSPVAMAIVMHDIDNIKPSFYKYHKEADNFDANDPYNYRANSRMGVILEESPDYIQDEKFSAIDIYALSTMTLVGVKSNREKIKEIEKNISDFGVEQLTASSIRVNFSQEFRSKNPAPVVTTTAMNSQADLYITNVSSSGFTVNTTNDTPVTFSWIAMAKVTENETINESAMDEFRRQHDLVVPEGTKEMMRNLGYEDETNENMISEREMKGSAVLNSTKELKAEVNESIAVETIDDKDIEEKIEIKDEEEN